MQFVPIYFYLALFIGFFYIYVNTPAEAVYKLPKDPESF